MDSQRWQSTSATGSIPSIWLAIPTLVAVSAIALYLGLKGVEFSGQEIVLLAIPLMALVSYVVWHHERLWIFTAFMCQGLTIIGGGDGIVLGDILYGIVVLGGLMVWLPKELLIHRRPLIRTGFDALFLTFFVVSTIVAAIASVLHDGLLQTFFTEWSVFCDLLLYFPVRAVMKDERDAKKLLLALALVLVCNSFYSLALYRERLLLAVFEFEVEGARSAGTETLSQAGLILSAILFGYSRRWKTMVLGLGGMALSLISLMLSFSRGPIVAGLVAMVLLIPLVVWRIRKRLLIAYVIAIVGGGTTLYLVFPAVTVEIFHSLILRISSVGEGTSDRSVQSRIIEARTVLRHIPESPIIGHGYGVQYRYYDPIRHTKILTSFIHVGWIWTFYVYGIPLALMFYLLLFFPTLKLLVKPIRRTTPFLHAIAVGTVCYLVAYLLTSITSNQFTGFGGSMMMLSSWALLDWVHRQSVLPLVAVQTGGSALSLPAGSRDQS